MNSASPERCLAHYEKPFPGFFVKHCYLVSAQFSPTAEALRESMPIGRGLMAGSYIQRAMALLNNLKPAQQAHRAMDGVSADSFSGNRAAWGFVVAESSVVGSKKGNGKKAH